MIELLGRPLKFGDSEQIAMVRKLEREAEEKELRKKYGCLTCEKTGKHETDCDQCDGAGVIEVDCDDCNGKGYNEPKDLIGGKG